MERISWEVSTKVESKDDTSLQQKRYPGQMDDEVCVGLFEEEDDSDKAWEGQEEDDRTKFEDLNYQTKRRGPKVGEWYPVFVKKSEIEKKDY